MAGLSLILICLGAGYALLRSGRLPAGAPAVLNAIVIHVSLPALALQGLSGNRLEADSLFPIAMAWVVFSGGAAFLWAVGRWQGWDRPTLGALILTGALGNTSFVGFPLLEALYGRESLPYGLLADQLGSFLVLSSLGLAVAAALAGAKTGFTQTLRKVAGFPPFIALVLGGILFRGAAPPDWLGAVLSRLSGTLVPIALFSVGCQMAEPREAGELRLGRRAQLAWGLLYKLALSPLLILALYRALGARGLALNVSVAEAAMAPMITGAVVASSFGLNAGLANQMVIIGIPLSLVSVPAWAWILERVAP